MSRISLKCFGVGDGWPCADRNHSSFLYRFGKTSVLIDAGEAVSGRYRASGLSYDVADALLFSHLHADHFAGFFMLLQSFWLKGRRKDLPIHMPGIGIKPMQGMIKAAMLVDDLLAFRMRFQALRSGKAIKIGAVRITPFSTTHVDDLKERFAKKYGNYFVAYSFLIESGKLRIGHSADIGRPDDLEPLLAKPLDLLVCELAHFSAEELCAYLRGRDIKRIIFVHLSDQYWRDLPKTRKLVARLLPDIPHTFAKDGAEFGF